MEEQARQAAAVMAQTGRIRVIVQDNGSAHTSKLARQRWASWEAKGLYLFFLPPYCSKMNRIETERHQLKTHELAGRMVEDEVDLDDAVMEGVAARGEAIGHTVERFTFKSTLGS